MSDTPTGSLRAGDADRERVAEQLRHHEAEGRLTVEELEERLESAFASRTVGELDLLLGDLPAPPGPPSVALSGPTVADRLPGVRPFTVAIEIPRPRAEVHAHVLREVAPRMHQHGFRLAGAGLDVLAFERRHRPAWVWLVAVLAFPLGLLAFAVRDAHRVDITLDERAPERTLMTIHGMAPRSMRVAFGLLRDGSPVRA